MLFLKIFDHNHYQTIVLRGNLGLWRCVLFFPLEVVVLEYERRHWREIDEAEVLWQ